MPPPPRAALDALPKGDGALQVGGGATNAAAAPWGFGWVAADRCWHQGDEGALDLFPLSRLISLRRSSIIKDKG